jgi:Tol biopolymer transport system component
VTIDKRADIWAFGVVLYEMLTGARLFDGETVSDVMAGVLKSEIGFEKLPADTPPSLRRLLRRCLERKPKNRLHDIADARIVIQEIVAGDVDATADKAEVAAPRTGFASKLPWLVAGLAVVVAIVAMMIGPTGRDAADGAAYELSLSGPSDGRLLIGSNEGWGVVSPDGRRIVVSATTSEGTGLWVRSLDRDDGRLLPGTETGFYPFWSPDSRWVAFFDRGELRRIEVEGGLPEKICASGWGRGGSWSETGRIIFTPVGGGSISVVDVNEGTPRQITETDGAMGEDAHYWPVWLPDGEHFLYFIRSGRREHQGIYLGRVPKDGIDPERRRIVASSSSGVFVPARNGEPAMLLWVQEETLLARAFDPESFMLSGPTSQIAEGVRVLASQRASMISTSDEGTLTFASSTFGKHRISWYDRQGRGPELIDALDWSHFQPRISPDGRWFTLVMVSGGNADVWLFDTETGEARALTTSAEYEESAGWSPDSREIVYRGGGKGMDFYRMPIDGSEAPQRVLADHTENILAIDAWVSDYWFVVDAVLEDASLELYGVHLDPTIEAVELVSGPGNQFGAAVAPDGQSMAFMSDESGSPEAYLVSLSLTDDRLAAGSNRHRVPVDRATSVAWSIDGSELYALTTEGELFAVPLRREGDRIRMGTPTKLFSAAIANPYFSAGPDRERFLILVDPDAEHQTLGVLLDWRARLELSSGE